MYTLILDPFIVKELVSGSKSIIPIFRCPYYPASNHPSVPDEMLSDILEPIRVNKNNCKLHDQLLGNEYIICCN